MESLHSKGIVFSTFIDNPHIAMILRLPVWYNSVELANLQ